MGSSSSTSASSSRVVDGHLDDRRNRYPTQIPNTTINDHRPINTLPTGSTNYTSRETYGYPSYTVLSTSSTYDASNSTTATLGPALPSIEQLERDDVARAIELSLTENYNTYRTSNLPNSTLTSSTFSQYPKNNVANVNGAKGSAVNSTSKGSTVNSTSKGEMSVECSICMEFNENYVFVATVCGHLFHKECITPWLQQAGGCPTCRVTISSGSLLKIFVSQSASSTSMASSSKVTDSNKNNNNNNINNTNRQNPRNQRRTNPNPNANLTSPIMFNRTIWLSSQDKQMTEQSLTRSITQRFNITPEKVSIKSLKKAGATQPPQRYVSFKISVDTERTFNTLNNLNNWPKTFRVREFRELHK